MLSKETDALDEKPPFFQTWISCYILVLIHLTVLILLFYWFTKLFE